MDKVLKNIINKTIDREFEIVMDNYSDHLKKNAKLEEEAEECRKKIIKITQELYVALPKEHHHLVDELDCAITEGMIIESRVAFKEGVILGILDLSYLGETDLMLRFV
jgi:hypothetical protein